MNESLHGFPSHEAGLAFHLRLGDHDPAAVADVCRAYLGPLLARLASRFPAVDPHLRQTAVHDALLGYVQAPHSYDPSRADLAAYLRMAARGDLLNLLQRESKHEKDRVAWTVVEDGVEDGNYSGEEDPSSQLQRAEEAAQGQAFLQGIRDGCTEEERGVLELMLAGERKTGTYARVIGRDGLPAAEQEREVKKVKGRIMKRLERGAPHHA